MVPIWAHIARGPTLARMGLGRVQEEFDTFMGNIFLQEEVPLQACLSKHLSCFLVECENVSFECFESDFAHVGPTWGSEVHVLEIFEDLYSW